MFKYSCIYRQRQQPLKTLQRQLSLTIQTFDITTSIIKSCNMGARYRSCIETAAWCRNEGTLEKFVWRWWRHESSVMTFIILSPEWIRFNTNARRSLTNTALDARENPALSHETIRPQPQKRDTWQNEEKKLFYTTVIQCLPKYSPHLAFFLFCCITTCYLNGFLFGFHVIDIHKIVQIGEVKWKK